SQKENILDSGSRNAGIIPICETFGRGAIDDLLALSGCTKIRIYTAMDSNNKIYFVITAVNSSDEDIYLSDTSQTETGVPSVVEAGIRCPEFCPPSSALNS
ncbi:MAG TPA: hypothetical protein VKH37_07360, partial [Ferruginibacter sp.]|nr:hypothetical protein [Ferruginibacter sp.]